MNISPREVALNRCRPSLSVFCCFLTSSLQKRVQKLTIEGLQYSVIIDFDIVGSQDSKQGYWLANSEFDCNNKMISITKIRAEISGPT